MIIPLINTMLVGTWFVFAVLYLNPTAKKPFNLFSNQDSLIRSSYRFNIKNRLPLITSASWVSAILISIMTENIFLLAAGLAAGAYLPGFFIEKKRRGQRIRIITKLVSPLRLLISRLPDQNNITKAIELTRNEIIDDEIRNIFSNYLKDVNICGNVHDALLNMKDSVSLSKFDVFIEYLLQTHYEGFTKESLNALSKSVEAIEFDLRAIEIVNEKSRTKKRNLYTALAVSWMFPVILSFANTGQRNVYLHTTAGKILILFYVVGSLFVYLKGEEYLTLNLDEL